jgi:hypothetical protein
MYGPSASRLGRKDQRLNVRVQERAADSRSVARNDGLPVSLFALPDIHTPFCIVSDLYLHFRYKFGFQSTSPTIERCLGNAIPEIWEV